MNEFHVRNGMITHGDVDLNGHTLRDSTGGNLNLATTGSGRISLNGLLMPTTVGSTGQALVVDGSGNLSWGMTGGASLDIQQEGVSQGAVTALNFTGPGITTTTNSGVTTLVIPGTKLKTEMVKINWTGTDVWASYENLTSGVVASNVANSSNTDIKSKFTFTGYNYPPAGIFFYGYDANNQRYSIRNMPLTAGINYTISTSGVVASPNTFGSFSELQLSTTVADFGGSKKSALPAIPAHGYVIFLMMG